MPSTVQDLVDAARRARADGDPQTCLATLEAAQVASRHLPPDHPLVQSTAWKRAKAEHDFGTPTRMLDALDPILDQDNPFEHYASGLDAVERLGRHYTDRAGYGDGRVEQLWHKWIAAQRALGDPFMAEMGELQVTWIRACQGDLAHLEGELNRVGSLHRRSLARSVSRHIEAEDAGNSVFFVQMPVARTVLTGAMWMGKERLAWDAWQLYEDAIEEVGRDRADDFWYLASVARAGRRFGWQQADKTIEMLYARLTKRDRDLHSALVAGELDMDVEPLLWAADQAIATHAGFEWAIDAWLVADGIAGGHRERALAMAREYAVSAFLF